MGQLLIDTTAGVTAVNDVLCTNCAPNELIYNPALSTTADLIG
jgi:hypothetical protein